MLSSSVPFDLKRLREISGSVARSNHGQRRFAYLADGAVFEMNEGNGFSGKVPAKTSM
jgi:hypothetical protein